jgi:hypothetical protein
LSQFFRYEFKLNSSLDNFYIIEVLVPESIVKAISIVHRIKLKEAEFLFVNYYLNLFNFNRIIKRIQNEAQQQLITKLTLNLTTNWTQINEYSNRKL